MIFLIYIFKSIIMVIVGKSFYHTPRHIWWHGKAAVKWDYSQHCAIKCDRYNKLSCYKLLIRSQNFRTHPWPGNRFLNCVKAVWMKLFYAPRQPPISNAIKTCAECKLKKFYVILSVAVFFPLFEQLKKFFQFTLSIGKLRKMKSGFKVDNLKFANRQSCICCYVVIQCCRKLRDK